MPLMIWPQPPVEPHVSHAELPDIPRTGYDVLPQFHALGYVLSIYSTGYILSTQHALSLLLAR